jgi:hypothetical protein
MMRAGRGCLAAPIPMTIETTMAARSDVHRATYIGNRVQSNLDLIFF